MENSETVLSAEWCSVRDVVCSDERRKNSSLSLYVCIHLFEKSKERNKLFIPSSCIYL